MMTYYQTVQYIKKELANHYPQGEISSFISLIFEHFENLSPVELHARYKEEIKHDILSKVNEAIRELKLHKPVQYILGETEFYNLRFYVTKDVLIPRPETEEMVDWIIKLNDKNKELKILDIGSGSGCIAISLEKHLHCKEVSGMEISRDAILVAKENAIRNDSRVHFRKRDILKIRQKSFRNKYHIIVSNPPYVTEKEKKLMDANVLLYEPDLALFVDDDDPLKYYSAICEFAAKNLLDQGQLFFEINEAYGNEVLNEVSRHKFQSVSLKKDIHGKDRMIQATWINNLIPGQI